MSWKKESGGDRQIYPDGTYKVEITGWEPCEAKTGTKQIRWFAEIQEPEEHKGGKIVDHTPLTEGSLWRLATLVNSCGLDLEEVPDMEVSSPAFNKILDQCNHRTVYWTVKFNEQYNNNKVEGYAITGEYLIKPDIQVEDKSCPF